MESSLLSYIWKYSRNQQITVVAMTMLSFPILYITLELPKWIINDALVGNVGLKSIFGLEFGAIPYLVVLCLLLLVLIIANGVLKMRINTFKGIIGERLVRRLRYNLIQNTLRFPLPYFSRISTGELISTATAETEPLGGYIGESIALPLFQGGTMLTILIFMFAQDWVFGLVSVALIPVQGYIIPKLQHQLNVLKKERVREVRKLSERIGETVAGATEIRLHGTQPYTLSEFSNRLGVLFGIRLEIFKKKFFMKFLNNTIGQITPFLFYLFGGYLVIKGDLTIGALVAAIGAYKDLTSPWRELLNFYQLHEDSKIKYEQIIELFNPDTMVDIDEIETESDVIHLKGDIALQNVSWRNEKGQQVLAGINLHIASGSMVAIIGDYAVRRARLAQLLAALEQPATGAVLVDGNPIDRIPDAIVRRRLSFQGPDPHMFAGTIVENIEYALNQHEPDFPDDPKIRAQLAEANVAGNRPPIDTGWLDYRQAGEPERERSPEWYQRVVNATGAQKIVYEHSLLEVFDPTNKPELAALLLAGRQEIRNRLSGMDRASAVTLFDPDQFNPNTSIAENLLFGIAVDHRLDCSAFEVHPYFIAVLDRMRLTSDAIQIGLKAGKNLVRMADKNTLSHELIEHFGLHDEDMLEKIRYTVDNYRDEENLSNSCSGLLISLFLLLIPERHRFVSFDDLLNDRLLQARREFKGNLPRELEDAVLPFDETTYHARLTVKDNLLFGRMSSQDPEGERFISELIEQVINEQDLRKELMLLLGESQVGISGSRLPLIGRHNISLCRALIKNPDIMIFQDALGPYQPEEMVRTRRDVRELLPNSTIIWIAREIADPTEFDEVYAFTEAGPLQKVESATASAEAELTAIRAARTSSPLELVSHSILFSALAPIHQQFIADHSRLVAVKKDSCIYRRDDEADSAWLVVSGEVKTQLPDNGQTGVTGTFRRPEVFGAMEVLADCPRVMSAYTSEDSVLLRMQASAIETVALSDAQVSRTLLRSLSNQWRV